ncbi:hypothetical protein A2U01_0084589, partial [Trifolium medium]|nr:hypothetical protein [Trifolium medium]
MRVILVAILTVSLNCLVIVEDGVLNTGDTKRGGDGEHQDCEEEDDAGSRDV